MVTEIRTANRNGHINRRRKYGKRKGIGGCDVKNDELKSLNLLPQTSRNGHVNRRRKGIGGCDVKNDELKSLNLLPQTSNPQDRSPSPDTDNKHVFVEPVTISSPSKFEIRQAIRLSFNNLNKAIATGSVDTASQLVQKIKEFGNAAAERKLGYIANKQYKLSRFAIKRGDLDRANSCIRMALVINPQDLRFMQTEAVIAGRVFNKSMDGDSVDRSVAVASAKHLVDIAQKLSTVEGENSPIDKKKSSTVNRHIADLAKATQFLRSVSASVVIEREIDKFNKLTKEAEKNRDISKFRQIEIGYERLIGFASENGVRDYRPWLGLASIRVREEKLGISLESLGDLSTPYYFSKQKHIKNANMQRDFPKNSSDKDRRETRIKGPLLKAASLIQKNNPSAWAKLIDVNIDAGLYNEVSDALVLAIDTQAISNQSAATYAKNDNFNLAELKDTALKLAWAYGEIAHSQISTQDCCSTKKAGPSREEAESQFRRLIWVAVRNIKIKELSDPSEDFRMHQALV